MWKLQLRYNHDAFLLDVYPDMVLIGRDAGMGQDAIICNPGHCGRGAPHHMGILVKPFTGGMHFWTPKVFGVLAWQFVWYLTIVAVASSASSAQLDAGKGAGRRGTVWTEWAAAWISLFRGKHTARTIIKAGRDSALEPPTPKIQAGNGEECVKLFVGVGINSSKRARTTHRIGRACALPEILARGLCQIHDISVI
ncbi:hypothetical protein GGTG_12692 [Gaeumannomyces tritici R3-111a-1]|uniref:Uncharacterized protein n=1 Tax=Gaeumannomyces tritici (strain R3-111a-1) TaxID=644352 RepID=J3PGR3_GAET3|nr:hypothetical protein GGTG_12692 [Gaeumannomyces tritici R3-111a-1]EJT69809.1 hypothetical protein GGTG_12692 [Gaeumannomyces tritici R3-111a-1]